MQAAGLYLEIQQRLGTEPPPETALNGTFVRWGRHKKFWLVAKNYGDHIYASYGDWSTGESFKWSTNKNKRQTKEAYQEINQNVAREQSRNRKLYSSYFWALIKECKEMVPIACPYAEKKGIPHSPNLYMTQEAIQIPSVEINAETKRLVKIGQNTLAKGTLVVPLMHKGEVSGVQTISPDGNKMFMKGSQIKGAHYTFGRLDRAHYAFIAEGIGTAGAIARQMNLKENVVVCAFNCGNLLEVVKEIREKEPTIKIVIAADNDEAGLEAAAKAAANTKNLIVRKPEKEGQDFADLDPKKIKELLKITREDFISIKSLGFTDSNYYFFSTYKNGVTKCGVSIGKSYILDIAPLKFWLKEYPTPNGANINADQCANYLKELSRDQGQFDPTKLRGSGYFNIGKKIYAASFGRTFMGEDQEMVHITGKKIYVPEEIQKDELKKLNKEVQMLTDAVSKFCWTNSLNGRLLMGWILSAPFSGCLPFRPHMWITGDSSSGKSWVRSQVVKPLLGNNVYDFTGDSTEAGIRAALKYDALPIMLDEFESEDIMQKKKRHRTLELLRQASSETDSTIVKGSSEGNAIIYKIITGAILFSVRSSLDFEANRNRFITLSFNREKQKDQNFLPIADFIQSMDLKYICEKNINYLFFNWDKFLENYKAMYKQLRGQMNDHLNRCYSVVSAALIMHDVSITSDEIIKIQKGLSEFVVEEKVSCLNHLIAAELKERGTPMGTILEIVGDIRDGDREANAVLRKILRRNGISYKTVEDTLEINIKHPNVLRVMSSYPDGNWAKSLITLDGASFKKEATFFVQGENGLKHGGRGAVIHLTGFYQRFGDK